jgi:hypothetical protein
MKLKLSEILEKIFDEFSEVFGHSDNLIAIKRKQIQIAKLKMQQILTGDDTLVNDIEIGEMQIEEMKPKKKPDFMETVIAIESRFKFQINLHETSVRKFYSYLKHLK